MLANLLETGHGVGQHQVQHGVVLHQRMVLVVPDELHHGGEGQGVREAILPLTVVDLNQLVVPILPGEVDTQTQHQTLNATLKQVCV